MSDLHHIPEPLKQAGDVGGVSGIIMAIVNIINPILETGILVLTAIWFVYRIKDFRSKNKKDNDE